MHFNRSIVLEDIIPLLKLIGEHFGVDVKRNGDHFRVSIISGSIWGSFQCWGSFRGRFGDHFRAGDHFGVGIGRDHFVSCTLRWRQIRNRWGRLGTRLRKFRFQPFSLTWDQALFYFILFFCFFGSRRKKGHKGIIGRGLWERAWSQASLFMSAHNKNWVIAWRHMCHMWKTIKMAA